MLPPLICTLQDKVNVDVLTDSLDVTPVSDDEHEDIEINGT